MSEINIKIIDSDEYSEDMVLFKKIRKTSKFDKKFEIWKFLHLTSKYELFR